MSKHDHCWLIDWILVVPALLFWAVFLVLNPACGALWSLAPLCLAGLMYAPASQGMDQRYRTVGRLVVIFSGLALITMELLRLLRMEPPVRSDWLAYFDLLALQMLFNGAVLLICRLLLNKSDPADSEG